MASQHLVKSIKTPTLQMGASSIIPNTRVIKVIFDQCINMYERVTSVCHAAYYYLKKIHCLKAFLTQEALVTVIHTVVTFHIDYCNSLVSLYSASEWLRLVLTLY